VEVTDSYPVLVCSKDQVRALSIKGSSSQYSAIRGSCETFYNAEIIYIVTNANATVRIDLTALLREVIMGDQRWHVLKIGLSLSLVRQAQLLLVIFSVFVLIHSPEIIICATLISTVFWFFMNKSSIPKKLAPLKYLLLPLCYLNPAFIYIPAVCADNPLLVMIALLQLDYIVSGHIPLDIPLMLFFGPCPEIHNFLGLITLFSKDLI